MSFRVTNLICCYNSSSGGPPRVVSAMSEAGVGHWQSGLITTDRVDGSHDRLLLTEFKGEARLLPASRAEGLSSWARLFRVGGAGSRRALLQSRPDVLHIHGLWSPMLAEMAAVAVRHRIPYVISPHGMLEPWSLGQGRLKKALALYTYQGRALRQAAAIHATSDQEADNIRRLGEVRSQIHVIPNAVDAPPADWTADSGMKRKPPTLLFLSRIHPKKGIDLLLEAWKQLPHSWRLAIVGSGEAAYVDALRRRCLDEKISGVSFHAHADGGLREQFYAEASAFVLPTYSENFGNVVAEALMRGLPVITTTGTPWSSLQERGCGWYVAPCVPALLGALRALVASDPLTLATMGEAGRRYAMASFTLDAVRGRLLDLYQKALGGPARAELPAARTRFAT